MYCSTAQGKISSPLFSAAVRIRLRACLCHCKHTYADLLFIQLYSDASHMHCSTAQGKRSSPLFSAAVRIRLRACLCHCKYTYGDLLFMQLYSDASHMHCSTPQGKIAPHCAVLLCKSGSEHACATAITPMEICCSYSCTVMQHKCTAALVRA